MFLVVDQMAVAGEMGEVYVIYDGLLLALPPPVERRFTYVAAEYGSWKPWQLKRTRF